MPDTPFEKPPKKVRVPPLGLFWWNIIKEASKNAWESAEAFDKLCIIYAGIFAVAMLMHAVTQELGDSMICWSIALSFIVWLVWFLWNIIKVPHKTFKDGLAAASAGATLVDVKKTKMQDFCLSILIAVIVSVFVGILVTENRQISQLKKQLNLPKEAAVSTKQTPEHLPPIHVDTTPVVKPESATTSEVKKIVAASSQSAETSEKSFQPLNMPHENIGTNSDDPILAALDEQDAQVAKQLAEAEAKAKAELEKNKAEANTWWKSNLQYYDYVIVTLSSILDKEASRDDDRVYTLSPSTSFIRCIPQEVDYDIGQTNIAQIRFQKNTNWDFQVFILNRDFGNRRTLSIRCKGGKLNVDTLNPDSSHMQTSVYDKTGRLVKNPIEDIKNARPIIDDSLRLLVGLQKRYLTQESLLDSKK